MKIIQKDKLTLKIFETRQQLGQNAAAEIAACFIKLLEQKEHISVIFAAAPSQNETLWTLREHSEIDWPRIHAYHMDEYVGLSQHAPQRFASYLKDALFDHVPLGRVEYLDPVGDPKAEAMRYAALLKEDPADVVCMGIGENGHIAFNDPHVADFHDPLAVKMVDLDSVCRMQQVHDGCFASLDRVPVSALTLTVPTLAAATYRFCMVPAASKAQAVKNTLEGEISVGCPASILRLTENSVMYCDADSASLLSGGL